MDSDSKKTIPSKPGGDKGTSDLEALRAKLGLTKPAAPAPGATGKEAAPKPAGAAAPSDFKFSFAEAKPADAAATTTQPSSPKAAAKAAAAASPKAKTGKGLAITVGAVCAVIFAAVGFQFGNGMGERSARNAFIKQAQSVLAYFSEPIAADEKNPAKGPRNETTNKFIEDYTRLYEENYGTIASLSKSLVEDGELPPDFDLAKFKKDVLEPLQTVCKTFLDGTEDYSAVDVAGGKVLGGDLGVEVLDFVEWADALRSRVEGLSLTLGLLESYTLSSPPPAGLAGEVLMVAEKSENEKGQVTNVDEVEVVGSPELDKDVEIKDVCEPLTLEVEVPVCGAKEGPQNERRLFDTYRKTQTEVVKQFLKVKVKDKEGKKYTARIERIYKLDIRDHQKPLLEKIVEGKTMEHKNLGRTLAILFESMNEIRQLAEGTEYKEFLDGVSAVAGQEPEFTL